MISLDTETTGIDFHHGAKPFFVTTCDEHGNQRFWEWEVDPLTREPFVPNSDLEEIRALVKDPAASHELVLQNPKFDVAALATVYPWLADNWDWKLTFDTLFAGHILASNQPHNLTDMVLHYLGEDIEPYEKKLESAVKLARRMVQMSRPTKGRPQGGPLRDWAIASGDRSDMPSAREKTWRYDYWLPRALWLAGYADDHPDWETVLSDYANADSAMTLPLWLAQRAEIERRGLWKIYLERLKVLPVAYRIEARGVTISGKRLEELTDEYVVESERAARVCVNIAADYGYDLQLPKSGNNKSLTQFCFGVPKSDDHPLFPDREKYLGLPVVARTDTGAPSLDKDAMDAYELVLPRASKQAAFIRALRGKRKRDTAIAYMAGYRRYWRPLRETVGCVVAAGFKLAELEIEFDGWYVLHPSLNPTGTDTLRWSSNNPNEQNISKKEGFNLRYCFGPAPGREWWSLDGKNMELRVPVYEAGEEEMIALFERPNDPPYYGSNHLLVSHLLFPKEFERCRTNGVLDGRIFKKEYSSSLYDRVKRGNFCLQYGGQEGLGDKTYGVKGAYKLVKSKFAKQEALNQKYIAFANKHGYVETLPDKSVDPKRGYPIMVSRTDWGMVEPTKPFSYHIQGTVSVWMEKAMVRCDRQLTDWNLKKGSAGYFMIMQVHDELTFDFPRGTGAEPWRTNLPRVKEIQRLMEMGGTDLGVPTPVSIEYHGDNWSEGITL